MTAEYYAAGSACKAIQYFCQLSANFGWPLSAPTVFYVDNKTMLSLVVAPQVCTRSRHFELVHHLIRQLYSRGLILLIHVLMTKLLTRELFLTARGVLFCLVYLP